MACRIDGVRDLSECMLGLLVVAIIDVRNLKHRHSDGECYK